MFLQVYGYCFSANEDLCAYCASYAIVLTTNKTNYIITMLCIENLYVEVNVCVTL